MPLTGQGRGRAYFAEYAEALGITTFEVATVRTDHAKTIARVVYLPGARDDEDPEHLRALTFHIQTLLRVDGIWQKVGAPQTLGTVDELAERAKQREGEDDG